MADYVTLMGAEQVANAGRAMSQATEDMKSTYSWFSDTCRQQQQFMDEWLTRFDGVLNHRDTQEQLRFANQAEYVSAAIKIIESLRSGTDLRSIPALKEAAPHMFDVAMEVQDRLLDMADTIKEKIPVEEYADDRDIMSGHYEP